MKLIYILLPLFFASACASTTETRAPSAVQGYCPAGYTQEGQTCVPGPGYIQAQEEFTCANGLYFSKNEGCKFLTMLVPKVKGATCPEGFVDDGNVLISGKLSMVCIVRR